MNAIHVKMKNPKTGEVHILSPQNALDMEQHNGWKRVGHVKVKEPRISDPQDVLDNPRGIQQRKNAAQASNDEEPDVDEEEVEDLSEVDLTPEDPEDDEVDPNDGDPEDDDPPSTRDAIAAGR